jgi:hypothetical protein
VAEDRQKAKNRARAGCAMVIIGILGILTSFAMCAIIASDWYVPICAGSVVLIIGGITIHVLNK